MNKQYYKAIFAALALSYFLYYASSAFNNASGDNWHFIDNVNLLIHEGGHIVFMPFGMFIYVLGGSLMQCLLPTIFVFYFWIRKEFYSAALLLLWVGQNFINVSVYAGDSVRMELPLLGGETSIHDWHWILSDLNALKYTDQIAAFLFWIGLILIVAGGIAAMKFALSDPIGDNTKVNN
ncbi:MAG: hypothetical protein JWO40_733 [Candidatus Doudnabacteria bacterium]|nr:hypothetical protein [Candidatus Doudnabacteria bacterium]